MQCAIQPTISPVVHFMHPTVLRTRHRALNCRAHVGRAFGDFDAGGL